MVSPEASDGRTIRSEIAVAIQAREGRLKVTVDVPKRGELARRAEAARVDGRTERRTKGRPARHGPRRNAPEANAPRAASVG